MNVHSGTINASDQKIKKAAHGEQPRFNQTKLGRYIEGSCYSKSATSGVTGAIPAISKESFTKSSKVAS